MLLAFINLPEMCPSLPRRACRKLTVTVAAVVVAAAQTANQVVAAVATVVKGATLMVAMLRFEKIQKWALYTKYNNSQIDIASLQDDRTIFG